MTNQPINFHIADQSINPNRNNFGIAMCGAKMWIWPDEVAQRNHFDDIVETMRCQECARSTNRYDN